MSTGIDAAVVERPLEYWLDYVTFFGPRQVLRLKDADHQVTLLADEACSLGWMFPKGTTPAGRRGGTQARGLLKLGRGRPGKVACGRYNAMA